MVSVECPAHKQLKRLREALDEASATGEPRAVHGVRVACRRLNELLELMAVWLDRDMVRGPRKAFKKTRKAFQQVRDLDVLLASLCQPQAREQLQPHELGQLEGELTRRREKAFERARRKCQRACPEDAIDEVERLCGILEKATADEQPALRGHLEEMFRERAVALLDCDPRQTETGDLHQVRIRLKRLRYVAELIRRFELSLSEELIKTLMGMQDLLGRWHDHLVAADCVARLGLRWRVSHGQTGWAARLLEYAAFRLWEAEEDRRQVIAEWAGLEQALREAEMPLAPAPCVSNEDTRAEHVAEVR